VQACVLAVSSQCCDDRLHSAVLARPHARGRVRGAQAHEHAAAISQHFALGWEAGHRPNCVFEKAELSRLLVNAARVGPRQVVYDAQAVRAHFTVGGVRKHRRNSKPNTRHAICLALLRSGGRQICERAAPALLGIQAARVLPQHGQQGSKYVSGICQAIIVVFNVHHDIP
jgi:hypothetical protein